MKSVKNIPASVHQRLKNAAEISGRTFNDVAQYYALERWLYRLSQSKCAADFILKGALLLVAWRVPVLRATRDIDLLAKTSNDLDFIKKVVSEICTTEVPEDGLIFDVGSVSTERIAEDADYKGVRAKFQARLATTRLAMQIDMGFSDVVTPAPVTIHYPTLLDGPEPVLRAYNRETAIAEKFEAMVSMGRLNSRMKDFFDIWLLATTSGFRGTELQAAIMATFERRGTVVSLDPVALSDEFALDPGKQLQWRAFARRIRPGPAPENFSEIITLLRGFLKPISEAAESKKSFNLEWHYPSGWKSSSPDS
jgi:predicted nucleotidyltransferase component of viral defense system